MLRPALTLLATLLAADSRPWPRTDREIIVPSRRLSSPQHWRRCSTSRGRFASKDRFQGSPPARISGGTVSLSQARARRGTRIRSVRRSSSWPASGLVQHWGVRSRKFDPGDIVSIPPGVKHWHGATATIAMTHIAISEALNGKTVDWMEHVSDEQYGR